MSVLQSAIAAASGSAGPAAYQIERSLRFNSADSAHLTWTPPAADNRRTWTWSGWVKRSTLQSSGYKMLFSAGATLTEAGYFAFGFSNDQIAITTGSAELRRTTAVYRDVSAFYHVVVSVDTTQSTAANRVRLYVNGTEVTVFSTNAAPTQNAELAVNSVVGHAFGRNSYNSADYFDGYITEVNFIDGQALTPSDFGETASATGVWIPKAYTGSYGNNGFYLPFNDNSTVLNLGRNRQTLTADPYFPVTTLLLNGNGSNGAQNNTFLDSSTNNFTITRNGNTTQGTFSPFSQTGWSGYFSGAQTSPSLSFPSNAAYSIGSTSDFTVEAWVYFTGGIGSEVSLVERFDGISGPGWIFGKSSGDKFWFGFAGSTYAGNTTVTANRWYHLCWMRTGGNSYLFVDGVLDRAAVATSNFTDGTAPLSIGERDSGSQTFPFTGYLSNLRIVKGTAVYSTSGFTVPTVPLTAITNTTLLTLQSNRFVDNSTTAATATVGSASSIQAFSPFAPTAAYSAATNGGSGYFDGTGDYLLTPSNAAFTFGTGDFTAEAWVYATSLSASNKVIFDFRSANDTSGYQIGLYSTTTPYVANSGGGILNGTATMVTNAWMHVAVTRASGTLRIFINGVQAGSTSNSLNCTNTVCNIGGNYSGGEAFPGYIANARVVKGTAVYTAAFTPPTALLTAITNTSLLLNFTNGGIINATGDTVLETVGTAQISTTQSKFGGSSMYFDGTVATSRVRGIGPLFNLGASDFTVEFWYYPTANNTTGYPVLWTNYETWTGGTGLYGQIGLLAGNKDRSPVNSIYLTLGDNYWYGSSTVPTLNTWMHIALVRQGNQFMVFINGVREINQTISVTMAANAMSIIGGGIDTGGLNKIFGYIDDFRQTNYARYTGNFTVPQAQFAYNQADINVKQWVPNNFSVTAGVGNDSLVDSPTWYGTDTGAGGEVRGNYCTWNPLGTAALLGNGNLDFNSNGGGRTAMGSIYVSSGKWYAEFVASTLDSAGGTQFGVSPITEVKDGYASSWMYAAGSGNKVGPGSGWPGSAYGASYTTGNVIGVALDMDAGTVTCYKNGVSQGVMASGLTGLWTFCTRGDGTCLHSVNFGQRPFAYTAPSGFKALCTQNLPTPAIGASAGTLANKQFDAIAYSGNSSTQTITTGFQPDFVWIKSRSTADIHSLQDVLRGARYYLISNSTAAEATQPDSDGISSFGSTGFTLGYTDSDAWNKTGNNYISWNWKANGAGVSNTAGSITSTVSVNTTAGFSIVTWNGNTAASANVGHGLGVTPAFIISKIRGTTNNWWCYHRSLGTSASIALNLTGASVADTWAVSSSTFTYNFGVAGTYNCVAYCFAEIAGFSKFGSYTGNGSTDGPFVYCGFRPRWILIKRTDTANDWYLHDTARSDYNVATKTLNPNLSAAEGTLYNYVDVLSNGFKCRTTDGGSNASGGTYIFAAFAEAPFNYARAR